MKGRGGLSRGKSWGFKRDSARREGRGGRGGSRGGGSRGRGNHRPFRRPDGDHHVYRPVGNDRTGAANGGVAVNISFGNFAFHEMEAVGQRGGGVRELSSLLRQARRRASAQKEQLRTREGIQERSEYLLGTALQRASGQKVKDDATRLTKALAKRRSKKRQSAKKWAKRLKGLEDSVENVVKDRTIAKQTMRARKDAKAKAKDKRKASMKSLSSGGKKTARAGKGGKGGKGKKKSGGGGWGTVK